MTVVRREQRRLGRLSLRSDHADMSTAHGRSFKSRKRDIHPAVQRWQSVTMGKNAHVLC